LLLLDEPFTGLDQASAAALVARLKGLQADGCLIIAATHDLEVAEGLLTRALFLRNGRVVRADDGSGGLRVRYQSAMAAS
jgi:ABC-type multidrug transport system ATPase subunit